MSKRRYIAASLMALAGIDQNGEIGPRLPKVHSDRYGNRSKYSLHQGPKERDRRVRQMKRDCVL